MFLDRFICHRQQVLMNLSSLKEKMVHSCALLVLKQVSCVQVHLMMVEKLGLLVN